MSGATTAAAEARRIDSPDRARWDALVADSEGASVFHTSAWAAIWTGLWRDARWEALVLEGAEGYAAGIPLIVRRRGFWHTLDPMPFATYGGPIVRRGHPDPAAARRALLEAFAAHARSRRVLRAGLAWYGEAAGEAPEGIEAREGFTHVLPLLADFEELAERFAPSTRRLIRQAEAGGLEARSITSSEDLRRFYEIAVETVRRRGGEPKPFSLYERIAAELVPTGLARYHLVLHGGEAIAGSLHLFHEGAAVSWLPVSRESAWPLRPNNFLIAHVLESLCAAGYLEYNFGASPPDAEGLIRFKEGWGATRRPVLLLERRSGLHRRVRA